MAEMNVLIVDDEPGIRTTLIEAIRGMGHTAAAAADGEEGLELAESEVFDVVLLDLKMPGMDGMEVLRRLRSTRPETAVIIITAHGSVDSAVEAMKLGAVDYLSKPFTLDTIRTAIQEAAGRLTADFPFGDDYAWNLEIARRALRRGEVSVASRYISRALEIDAARPQAHNLAGVVAEVEGRLFDAQQAYRTALECDPSYAPAKSNLHESVAASTRDSFFLSEVKRERVVPRSR